MSCACQSNGTIASITPVRPPITNTKKKPNTYSIGTSQRGLPCASVASQAKICTAVGIATIAEPAEKNASARCGMPTVNMWCTQMPKLRKASAMIATTMAR